MSQHLYELQMLLSNRWVEVVPNAVKDLRVTQARQIVHGVNRVVV
jgi:hypothetical protein